MKLRDIDFGHVLGASGVEGFFGEGYPYHAYARILGLNFDGMTFVSKTTTLAPRKGNLPVKEDGITPKEFFPDCIRTRLFKQAALNSVGLTGPGAEALLADGRWQQRTEPFLISFMSVAKTSALRVREFREFCYQVAARIALFKAPFGLQVNASCPNVGLDPASLLGEIAKYCEITKKILDIPVMVKLNALVSARVTAEIAQTNHLDALCCSNTLPWGSLPDVINWKKLWGSHTSPLSHLGGGGLSGAPLLPIVLHWLSAVRDMGVTIPINAGGGILSPADAELYMHAGADSVFIGSMAFLRPWNVKPTIDFVNTHMNGR